MAAKLPTSRRQFLADLDQGQRMARNELNTHFSVCEFDERAAMVWLARWFIKWELVAGRKRLGVLLDVLARKNPGEVSNG